MAHHRFPTARRALLPAPSLAGLSAVLFSRLWANLVLWQHRASSRHHLALMSEHDLKDIGVSRGAAEREINKPFWRR
jgi:uncharacterized protein YjiS (DUF1127 family)